MKVLYVIIGGGLGALLRFFIIELIQVLKGTIKQPVEFPHDTITSNIIACFIAGLYIFNLSHTTNLQWLNFLTTFLLIGFAGALSTFSSFALDVVLMYNSKRAIKAIGYVVLTLALSFTGFYLAAL